MTSANEPIKSESTVNIKGECDVQPKRKEGKYYSYIRANIQTLIDWRNIVVQQ